MIELDGQRTHVLRPPIPWSLVPPLTACGRDSEPLDSTLTLDEARALSSKLGKQRFALVICMPCAHRAAYTPTFDVDPLGRLRQERAADHSGGAQTRAELLALAELSARHSDEYQGLVSEIRDMVRLSDRRKGHSA